MEGLRNFVKMDIHCALEVGHLKEGTSSFEVRRPKCEEESTEVFIREGAEELTLRAEEVGYQKSCINVDHIAQDRWDCTWWMLIGMPSAGRSAKEFKGNEHYEELSRKAGAKKPSENQKSESPLEIEGSQGQGRGLL